MQWLQSSKIEWEQNCINRTCGVAKEALQKLFDNALCMLKSDSDYGNSNPIYPIILSYHTELHVPINFVNDTIIYQGISYASCAWEIAIMLGR